MGTCSSLPDAVQVHGAYAADGFSSWDAVGPSRKHLHAASAPPPKPPPSPSTAWPGRVALKLVELSPKDGEEDDEEDEEEAAVGTAAASWARDGSWDLHKAYRSGSLQSTQPLTACGSSGDLRAAAAAARPGRSCVLRSSSRGSAAWSSAPLAAPAAAPDDTPGPSHWSSKCASWLGLDGAAAEGDPADAAAGGAAVRCPAGGDDDVSLVVEGRLGGNHTTEVLRGWYNGAPAAIKVMHNSHNKSIARALEMAVLTSATHPGIVQAFACLPVVARLPGGPSAREDGSHPRAAERLRFRYLPADELGPGDVACSVVITELCDLGTLRAALGRGCALGLAASAVGLWADLLLDIAGALAFLHGVNLVHGDVKADNVFLKSCDARPLGMQAKLGGFGSAMVLDGDATAVGLLPRRDAASRILGFAATGLALADDVFAFGALLHRVLEAICTAGACREAAPGLIRFRALAAKCTAPRPADRPPMAAVADGLALLAGAVE